MNRVNKQGVRLGQLADFHNFKRFKLISNMLNIDVNRSLHSKLMNSASGEREKKVNNTRPIIDFLFLKSMRILIGTQFDV